MLEMGSRIYMEYCTQSRRFLTRFMICGHYPDSPWHHICLVTFSHAPRSEEGELASLQNVWVLDNTYKDEKTAGAREDARTHTYTHMHTHIPFAC